MTRPQFVGIDFGTTNSAIAQTTAQNDVQLAQFKFLGKPTHLFRSILYFSFEQRDNWGRAQSYAGPEAMENYLEEDGNGRLLISPKSSVASTLFDGTQILYNRYKHEELVAIILRKLCEQAREQFGELGTHVVAGRPVRFAGTEDHIDEDLALERLTKAYQSVGFEEIVFEYEPVAAAANYESSLTQDELVLVADFGGGTTDFCVMQAGPGTQALSHKEKILVTHGVGIAGDMFDSRIVEALIAPKFGKGTSYVSEFSKTLPVPVWPYGYLSKWYLANFLTEPKTLNMLNKIHRTASHPERIEAFLDFIEGNLGFHLYRSVEQSKVQLSSQSESSFSFEELTEPLHEMIARKDFEHWIDKEIETIATCCDETLELAGLKRREIDRVFLTGGTSFVPRVRQLFLDRFGAEKMGQGDELTSVASGLARRAEQVFSQ